MLVRLAIRDVVLIDNLELSFTPGYAVLTGETGAGKSILLDALGLALGQRGDPGLIRHGMSQASVVAEFLVPGCRELLEEHGIEPQETLMLKRILQRAGHSKAYINDQPVTVGLLKRFGEELLEIHGQFDRLLTPSTHRAALDAFAKIHHGPVREAFQRWVVAKEALEKARETHLRILEERAFREAQARELTTLNPRHGEEEELLELRQRLSQGQRIYGSLQQAATCLSDTQGALSSLYQAEKAIQRVQDVLGDSGLPLLESLSKAIVETTDVHKTLQDIQYDLRYDPQRLGEIDDRIHALRQAARKYMVTTDALAVLREEAETRLQFLEQGDVIVEDLSQAATEACEHYKAQAGALTKTRLAAKKILEEAIHRELPALKLAQVRFDVKIDPLEANHWSESGMDDVAFYLATNPGQEPGPLAKVASGGELARLMLALKVVLAEENQRCTLIFDEIDQGVGGAVASAIGKRLVQLAQHCQVVAITHSPQVAAMAQLHFRVSKGLSELTGLAHTCVETLTDDQRREELARMLSGQEITGEARAAADRLLQQTGI